MTVRRKKIDPSSIPAAKGGREDAKWQEAVLGFVRSGNEAEEVFSEYDGRKASTGLRGAIRGLGLEGKIIATRRGDRVFLVKED